MLRMRLNLTLASILFFSLLTSHAQDSAGAGSREDILVGGRTVKLPEPVGFGRIDGLNPATDRMVEAMLPATNRYLARFDPPKGTTSSQGRSFNAQVLRAIESREIGDRTFSEMKQQTKAELDKAQESLRQEIAKVSGKAEKALQDATDPDAALSVSDVAVLGYFDDSPSSLGFTMALNIAAKAGAKSAKARLVVASVIVPVNGRLIYLYANAGFNSAADRTWAEQAVTAWRDQVIAANPRVEGPAVTSSIFQGLGRSTVIGAIIGALVGGAAMLLKKKKP